MTWGVEFSDRGPKPVVTVNSSCEKSETYTFLRNMDITGDYSSIYTLHSGKESNLQDMFERISIRSSDNWRWKNFILRYNLQRAFPHSPFRARKMSALITKIFDEEI